ncbi:alpha/beta hydrolase [Vibrio hannami]|uniref:alpha/beta hydrolase n=1 Tax=Vibrio hannami TaxID=2717094 RepID=UPI00240ED24F|nr:alpha/beta hydrolase [Vibrio hannami]MDG3087898.1 alpha/beta hydrolase [Vibrio hannami]
MLFITNRVPVQSARSKVNRRISFNYDNTSPSAYLYFCERTGKDEYKEIKQDAFFSQLKSLSNETQILFYLHGFNNNMEPDIFGNAAQLQKLINEQSDGNTLVKVIPLIWPCDDDSPIHLADDYYDDQDAADGSGLAFSRLLGKFDTWRQAEAQTKELCVKRINILAHSMGNRVLKNALQKWAQDYSNGNMPQLFRNVFMIAADVENETLEKGEAGQYIVDSGRNIVVYYANDDLAMPASKVANTLRMKTMSRRMGMTGPEDLSRLPKKVYEVDCDDFNNRFDSPKGHSYFLTDSDGNVSPIIAHMVKAIDTGRVPGERSDRLTVD